VTDHEVFSGIVNDTAGRAFTGTGMSCQIIMLILSVLIPARLKVYIPVISYFTGKNTGKSGKTKKTGIDSPLPRMKTE